MSKEITVSVPDIGDFTDVEIVEILVQAGDQIAVEDSLITLETDKATMEIPSSTAGKVVKLLVKPGDKVSVGSPILTVAAEASETTDAAATAKANEKSAPPETDSTAANAAAKTSGSTKTITVPDIGDFKNVPIIEILVKAGDTVNAEESLLTLESDKASIEVPSPETGTIAAVLVKVGDQVSEGSEIFKILTAGDNPTVSATTVTAVKQPAPTDTNIATASTPQAAAVAASISSGSSESTYSSPSVRKLARELDIDLSKVQASGVKGRITKDDLHQHIKQAMAGGGSGMSVAALPNIDFSNFGEIETQALTKINKLTGSNLHRSWSYIPHVTQFDEADITELEAFRKQLNTEYQKQNIKLTIVAFLVKAVVKALQTFPRFNASLDNTGNNLILKKYYHIGIAVDTPDGLVVPVIRDAEQKGIVELANVIVDLATRARDKKLKQSEMQGGCFSISSLGGVGGTAFTPIVNLPEVAILGISPAAMKPIYNGKEFLPRLMLPLSLSYDHRVVDGVAAAKFTSYLSQVLADSRRLLL